MNTIDINLFRIQRDALNDFLLELYDNPDKKNLYDNLRGLENLLDAIFDDLVDYEESYIISAHKNK